MTGNAALTRGLTDMAWAKAMAQAIRFYAMSAIYWKDPGSGYYPILESIRRRDDINPGLLEWFSLLLLEHLRQACWAMGDASANDNFWSSHAPGRPLPNKISQRLADVKNGPKRISRPSISHVGQKVSKAPATAPD